MLREVDVFSGVVSIRELADRIRNSSYGFGMSRGAERGADANTAKVLAGRRMYHVSMGLLEAAMYGIPISFFGGFAAASLETFLTLALGFLIWGLVAVWVLRRADAKFRKGASGRMPSGNTDLLTRNMQTSVLKYSAIASAVLLAFVLLPILLSLFIPIGFWVSPEGLGFFAFTFLLAFTAIFSLGGVWIPSLRDRVYPEYPGFFATCLFALAMVAFFVSYILAM